MSIWDAYIYKKFGTSFQDVLSIKSKLGNQVYSPLLWLPGSTTLPFASYKAQFQQLTGSDTTITDISGSNIAAQAAGSANFVITQAGTPVDFAYLTAGTIVQVSGATCAAAGFYTIKTSSASGTLTLVVDEAIPE